ncbi:hypothetical protein CTM88_20875 [Photobacterium aquimaris]|uniref:Uncharacterized protein n=1 Tax=Photobacterium aquimaris TaxID=512643 RepID=A0A2T3IEB1_9GAMM|nr:hypothetical protein [Photobacterium aquimaris]OBU14471.1 hypothetical protein AYY20_20705 [Photobacterium aquimaris]PSU20920.1 hypothetical protein CTM88_20875 [Photobacterium aquimaris]
MENKNTEQVITGPIAAIIITLTVCLTVLFAIGVFTPAKLDYATVNFDGGYQKIGVISQQRGFSDVKVVFNDKVLWSGSLDNVADEIAKSIASEKDPQNITWKDGVTLNGIAGVKWDGSENSFKLTTETINLVSTKETPLIVQNVINQLVALDRKVKYENKINAKQALTFSEAPSTSFTLTKFASLLRNL